MASILVSPIFSPLIGYGRHVHNLMRASGLNSSVVPAETSEILRQEAQQLSSSLFPAIKGAKRVVLVWHGESTWNVEGRIQGSSHFSVLTPKGESQAETSRLMLLSDTFDACFSTFTQAFNSLFS